MKITLLIGKIFDIEKEIDFPIKVVRSSRAKKLSLRIDIKKRMPVLTVPRFCSKKRAVTFVNENKGWIDTHLAKLPLSKFFKDGEEILLLGQKIHIKHAPEVKCGVFLDNGILYVSGEEEFLHRRVKDYIKEQAAKKFLELSREKSQRIGCQVKRVCIKDTKTRWGSCSTLNNLNYSWRIALAPAEVIDYMMAHEVAHLKHHNHSQEFWDCVKGLCSNYQESEKWLKKYGAELNLYE